MKSLWFRCISFNELNVSLQLAPYMKVADPNEIYVSMCLQGRQNNFGTVLYPRGNFIYSSLSSSLIYGQFLLIFLFLAHSNDCFGKKKAITQCCQTGHTLHALRRGPEPVYDTCHVWGEFEISLQFHKTGKVHSGI